jgi:hypothetical protein
MALYIVVSRSLNEETDEEDMEVRGLEEKGGRVVLEKIFRMPSLATADLEAAEALADNIARNVKVVDNGSGARRFKF